MYFFSCCAKIKIDCIAKYINLLIIILGLKQAVKSFTEHKSFCLCVCMCVYSVLKMLRACVLIRVNYD